jgi:2-polyprenyl-6-hydroxyphenyl methylase/3-demethylubiquinone-9 3-methyltransferase
MRNDQTIYRTYASNWWDDSQRFLRVLHNLVPARLRHFDPIIGSWDGKAVLDLGCGGGFMSEALATKGARVTGVDPSQAAIEAAQDHAQAEGLKIDYKVGTGESVPLPVLLRHDKPKPTRSTRHRPHRRNGLAALAAWNARSK